MWYNMIIMLNKNMERNKRRYASVSPTPAKVSMLHKVNVRLPIENVRTKLSLGEQMQLLLKRPMVQQILVPLYPGSISKGAAKKKEKTVSDVKLIVEDKRETMDKVKKKFINHKRNRTLLPEILKRHKTFNDLKPEKYLRNPLYSPDSDSESDLKPTATWEYIQRENAAHLSGNEIKINSCNIVPNDTISNLKRYMNSKISFVKRKRKPKVLVKKPQRIILSLPTLPYIV